MALRLLHGDIEQARKKQPILLRGITVVQKLGFSDIIMPGEEGRSYMRKGGAMCDMGGAMCDMGGAV